ncbi:MAG: helix-hairpin-helix domain-containing protein [bacterium]|nr:helix-hairpin-helix domain-containing protein [bacterium]
MPTHRSDAPRLHPRAVVGIAILALAIVGFLAVRSWATGSSVTLPAPSSAPTSRTLFPDGGPSPPAPGSPSADAGTPGLPATPVVVHVTGAVESPGVFELPAGSRIDDAITRAGGFTEDAEESGLNRATVLVDGQQVYVPRVGEAPPAAVGPAAPPGTPAGSPQGPININTATAEQLQELPGIGPSLAGSIIRWREDNGGFSSLEELDEVSGIGPVLMERLRELVTV